MKKPYSEETLELLLDTIPDYIFYKDLNGRDIYSNNKKHKDKEELFRLKEGFICNIAHEFRTPINMMLNSLQLLEYKCNSKSVDDFRHEFQNGISNIKLNIFRLLKLSNNFVDLAELQSAQVKYTPDNYNIVNVVETLCDEINMYANEFLPSKDVKIIFDTDIEELMVGFDKFKLDRILLNLISNSIKFSKKSSKIYVKISLEETYVTLSVKDYGVGIKHTDIYALFNSGGHILNGLTKRAEGCGIGLEITKHLVDLHNGEIEVESILDKGAEFTVKLPLVLISNKTTSKIVSKILYNRLDRIKMELSDIYDDTD